MKMGSKKARAILKAAEIRLDAEGGAEIFYEGAWMPLGTTDAAGEAGGQVGVDDAEQLRADLIRDAMGAFVGNEFLVVDAATDG